MSLSTTTFKSAAAAVAIAAAAVATPAAIAQADEITAAGSGWAGNSALGYLLDGDTTYPIDDPLFDEDGRMLPTFFQNDFWWFGPANPEAPAPIAEFTFEPINMLPGFLKPVWGWFFPGDIDSEACILGASIKFGPYGSVTGGLARHC